MAQRITPEEHKRQIEAYAREYPAYEIYAEALRRVLDNACKDSIRERIVQARPKSLSGFAEKCVRKFPKYSDAVHEFTDLCGARVIVQTLEHVKAVKMFIEKNFDAFEQEDKGSLLGEDRFGYRDMHYLVRLKPDRSLSIGFKDEEIQTIGARVAEVQVRSMAQHAWADTLHDRTYKTPLTLSPEMKRTAALLAAIMEDGDRTFDRLTGEIDGMVANYTAYADRRLVEDEMETLRLILQNESALERRAVLALELARLLGRIGEYDQMLEVLEPFKQVEPPVGIELVLELGHALCRVHRQKPQSDQYKKGQQYIEDVIRHCRSDDYILVPNLKRVRSLHARALSRLAWSWEATLPRTSSKALQCYREAREIEPSNPYHLANQLGFEIYRDSKSAKPIVASARSQVQQAVVTCRDHALAGTELPYALFTAGRLSLLLRQGVQALAWYARGLRHVFTEKTPVPFDFLQDEMEWIERLQFGDDSPPQEYSWIRRLIALRSSFSSSVKCERPRAAVGPENRTLIVAGGAGTMTGAMLARVRPGLAKTLEQFQGTVISGGTKCGIPGLVGELAEELRQSKRKQFKLVGYRPEFLPEDAPKDARYDDDRVLLGEKAFSPEQVLWMWEELQKAGIRPEQVLLLGFGGGPVTAVEYRVAFALGALVAIVESSGGEADIILSDPVWTGEPSLMVLPFDQASIQAFTAEAISPFGPEVVEEMAREIHKRYVEGQAGRLPENLRPWEKLPGTFQTANFEQARCVVKILRGAGFDVRSATGKGDAITSFMDPKFDDDVERMAELEHGRWNVERLRNGWRPGKQRDDAKKIHDCLKPWNHLPDHIKEYDRHAVRAFPQILDRAGLEIVRR